MKLVAMKFYQSELMDIGRPFHFDLQRQTNRKRQTFSPNIFHKIFKEIAVSEFIRSAGQKK